MSSSLKAVDAPAPPLQLPKRKSRVTSFLCSPYLPSGVALQTGAFACSSRGRTTNYLLFAYVSGHIAANNLRREMKMKMKIAQNDRMNETVEGMQIDC
jgi:hypothetical protein